VSAPAQWPVAALALRAAVFGFGVFLLGLAVAEFAVPDALLYSEEPALPPWWCRALFAAWATTFGAVLMVSPRQLARHPRWFAAAAAAVLVWPVVRFARDGRGPADVVRFVVFLGPLALQGLLAVLASRTPGLSTPPPRATP
jgi:hypothetical protein